MGRVEETAAERLAFTQRLARTPAFSSLRLDQFRYLLVGTATAQVGGWMEEVARGWLVLHLTDSAFQLGLVAFLRGISTLVFSPLAGVLVERMDRRRLAIFTQVVPGAVSLIVGLLVGLGWVQMWHLYLLAVVVGANVAVNMPARQVLVYDVVGAEHLTSAVALNAVAGNVARIVAPSMGGALIGLAGIAVAFYGQATFYGLAVVATVLLRPLTHVESVHVPVMKGMREGYDYVRRDEALSRLVLMNVIVNVLIYPYVTMMAVFAKDILDVGSAGYGFLLTGASIFVTLNQILLQLGLDDAYRGRGMALYNMAGGLTPFGNLGMGAAAEQFGAPHSVASFAAVGLVLVSMAGIASRKVRRL